MVKAQQLGVLPISGLQAPTVPMQSATLPAQADSAFDISSIMNLMLMMMVMVMMMKMMSKATESV